MATSEKKKANAKFREIVADIVGELRGAEVARSFAAITLEELIDQHLELMMETKSQTKPSRLDYVKRTYNALVNNIEEMKNTSPEEFDTRDTNDEVNTPPDGGA